MKGKNRSIWTNAQINLMFENNVIGHLRGSYDGDFPSGSFGIENLEIVGSDGRIVIDNACEALEFFPRRSRSSERYECLGGMRHFDETFHSRIKVWVDDNLNNVKPEEVNGSAKEGLDVQLTIEATIQSFENNSVIDL